MFGFLHRYLDNAIKKGDLTVVDAGGAEHRFGDGSGKPVRVRINDRSLYFKLFLRPDPILGEAYADGRLVIEEGSIYDLLYLTASQMDFRYAYQWRTGSAIVALLHRMAKINTISRSRKNISHHYDLNGEFYDLFLDSDRQYSCAYFEPKERSLHRAQLAKKRHIAAKLNIEPGMRVLDIGCGWGGMALYLAENCAAHVVGVTLSTEQQQMAQQRVRNRGLEDQVDVRLMDYRLVDEEFDRIVSVGMFEHVGPRHYGEYFDKVNSLLHKDGVALLHTIGRPHGPHATSAFIERYIFPGGYIPALSEMQRTIENSGLYVTDLEVLRTHYAETLKHWRNRFAGHRKKAEEIYDERFCRIWEYYLAGSEVAFRLEYTNVFQIQLTRHQHALPQTRNYMQANEEALRKIDSASCRPRSISSAR